MTKKEQKKRRKELWCEIKMAIRDERQIRWTRDNSNPNLAVEDGKDYVVLNEAYIVPYGVTMDDVSDEIRQEVRDVLTGVKEMPSDVLKSFAKA